MKFNNGFGFDCRKPVISIKNDFEINSKNVTTITNEDNYANRTLVRSKKGCTYQGGLQEVTLKIVRCMQYFPKKFQVLRGKEFFS